jgi:3-carboxy-cis,cis-muconate cycloisomerase
MLQAMLDVEVALAQAQASVGVIPSSAVPPIAEAARVGNLDADAIVHEAEHAGNAAIPLVQHLARRVAERDAAAARYVHWGATSQDIIDTALVLRLRATVPAIEADVDRARRGAAAHARRYLDTPMAGRTWLQQATPTTFGLKAAGWLDALTRARRGVRTAFDDVLVVQFGGASGTLASLGDKGPQVSAALARELKLREPVQPWHTHRERLAALSCALGVLCGTLGKLGRDLALLAQTEVGEAREARASAGGSSTMPQKQNPVCAAAMIAASVRVPGLVATMLSAMAQEHERGLGTWPAEWDTIPELVRTTASSARAGATVLEHLVVDSDRMRVNLDLTRGLIMAEAVTMKLAERLGKQAAHTLMEAAARRATDEHRDLAEILRRDGTITASLDPAELARIMKPEAYLGSARLFIQRTLDAYESGRDA